LGHFYVTAILKEGELFKRYVKGYKQSAKYYIEAQCMLAREGDLIKHKSNVIFDVKGLIHPEGKIIAFPRYIPDPQGPRHGNGAS
jgi:hypothetical protein